MKYFIALLVIAISLSVYAQNTTVQVDRNGAAPLAKSINFSDPALQDWDPFVLTITEGPKEDEDYIPEKEIVDQRRAQHVRINTQNNARGTTPPAPIMLNNFTANTAQGTPNDNHVAVSDSGIVVSVVNSNIRVYNDTGLVLMSKGLSSFAFSLGILQNISDPRVIYDPIEKRFIVIFFSGSASNTSKVIVAFSQTPDPTGTWNFYKLSGNYLNDTTWSDYPIVTISDKDLFMTFNQLRDNSDWQTGFRYSIIWQIDKHRGYNGDTLKYNYWHNIEYNGNPVWNVCPVQGGSNPSGPETYLLSVRPHDLNSDTVFLHTITDSYQSGNAQFSTKVLTTNVPYGLPPNALQKDGQHLATNDARVLSGFVENNRIQYVQNTVDPATMTASVYLGNVDLSNTASPVVTGQIISTDTIDYGYPSIAYIGNGAFDNRAIITCSYSSTDTFPGTVAFYSDANGNISEKLVVKTGESGVNILNDSLERWGDYTGVQRVYNEPNTAWLSGSYVNTSHRYLSWVAKVVNTDSALVSSINDVRKDFKSIVYPNPASEKFTLQIDLPEHNYVGFQLYDLNGRLVKTLLEDNFKEGQSIFSFNTQYLSSGIYFLKIYDRGSLLHTEKIVISR
jgi:hypothetical protein